MKQKPSSAAKQKQVDEQSLPLFCDFSCPHADFSKDVSGACRREQVVWCKILSRHNNKHNRCLAKEVVTSSR
jgi:hypothetical protein